MERDTLLGNIISTRRHIDEVGSLVSRQRIVVAELIIERRSTTAAREALAAMETFLISLVATRNELEAEFAEYPLEQRDKVSRRMRS